MSQPPLAVRKAVSRVAAAAHWGTPEQLADAKRELTALNLERSIQQALASAPPLTADQRASLAALLIGGSK